MEVYLRVLENVLAAGTPALILVPEEIDLIPPCIIFSFFRERFNISIDILHSGINNKKRFFSMYGYVLEEMKIQLL
ncbi:hypothetical protein [Candidatus Pantoea carbekii]|uniref:hypothetical protein n=1 Tax=Candidatus Pantoea carbekii TaxID=1235990 RepID=UPI000AFE0112|nr:hypothetical protein [Candidatus Pantoea carbekii]